MPYIKDTHEFTQAGHRKGPGAAIKLTVDAPANTVDQRIDWAAVLAGNLETGQQFEFNVYDPETGVSRVAPIEQVRVPAGTYSAYRVIHQMEKTGRAEQYQMLAS